MIDSVNTTVNRLVENNVNDFRLIHAERQPPNLKSNLTNSLFANKIAILVLIEQMAMLSTTFTGNLIYV